MPFPFSDWMPWWLQLALLILGMLFLFLWMLVPFAVFGVKGRLDALALQIEDLQAELRVLAVQPEDRVPVSAPAPRPAPAAAPVVEPVAPAPPPARPPGPVATSDAYVARPERPVSARPTRFDPPPSAPASVRAAPPVEPPAYAPRAAAPAAHDASRPMPWHDRPATAPRDPVFVPPEAARPPSMPPPVAPAPPGMADEPPRPAYRPPEEREMRARRDDEWDDRPRSEPTLRWPPRT
ncbi:hypothetical protein [Gluconacetobacter takamatsuzukensis]|uniref:Uncharacterized protein n=1 Tax=Gluconacetobacter takamatsuzukensis TaxID=1286190 RepID=A0A7W4KDN6_9PROT|nr:hypothetical protein [Gluconacetobacter takamatsuzukensis]MBB2204981.1 hypothetical protein [Gluconacetobacter takamatsuzukensis]